MARHWSPVLVLSSRGTWGRTPRARRAARPRAAHRPLNDRQLRVETRNAYPKPDLTPARTESARGDVGGASCPEHRVEQVFRYTADFLTFADS
jgi:hypothetical protein